MRILWGGVLVFWSQNILTPSRCHNGQCGIRERSSRRAGICQLPRDARQHNDLLLGQHVRSNRLIPEYSNRYAWPHLFNVLCKKDWSIPVITRTPAVLLSVCVLHFPNGTNKSIYNIQWKGGPIAMASLLCFFAMVWRAFSAVIKNWCYRVIPFCYYYIRLHIDGRFSSSSSSSSDGGCGGGAL